MMKKIVPTEFPLAQSANRVALLCGVVAGTVDRAEVEAAVINDTLPRPYKKAVCAEGQYYRSITEAARSRVLARNSRMNKERYRLAVQAEAKQIARMCDQDCWNGYYWTE
jgi:hypothetical protein